MATAAEIRKKVREKERDRIRAREKMAVDVATKHEQLEAAQTAVAAALVEFRRAAGTALKDFTLSDLATVTGISRSTLRPAHTTPPTDRETSTDSETPQPAPPGRESSA